MSLTSLRVRLWAEIGEFLFDDVVQFVSNFAINTIPVATLKVGIGRRTDTAKLAALHQHLRQLAPRQPAKVYLQADVLAKYTTEAPGVPLGEPVLIFEGELAGIGWQRQQSTCEATLHLTHWLSQLNYSSSISSASHPANPAAFSYPGMFRATADRGFGTATPGVVGWVPRIDERFVDVTKFSDIWGNIFHRWLLDVAKQDPIDERLVAGIADGKGDLQVLRALARLAPNPDGVPMNFDAQGDDSSSLVDSLRSYLQLAGSRSWTSVTLWNKIVDDWCGAYWMCLVPRISDALVIPRTGSIRSDPWVTISSSEYNSALLSAQMPQMLRAVGLAHPTKSNAGTFTGDDPDRAGLAGWFQPVATETGMIMLKQPPVWANHMWLNDRMGDLAEGLTGDPVTTGVDATVAGKTKEDINKELLTRRRLSTILDRYAQQWYNIETTRGRTGEISGKLRLDIAPGSSVLVLAAGSSNVPKAFELAQDMYANVVQVGFLIDAEAQRAGTGLVLSHIHTESEHENPAYTMIAPALYKDWWTGGSMIASKEARDAVAKMEDDLT